MRESPHFAKPSLAGRRLEFLRMVDSQELADRVYDSLPDAKFGKVIGTDIAREILPAYASSRDAALELTELTADIGRAYARDRLWREIHSPKGRNTLMLMAGGVGAGKSTAVSDELIDSRDLVYDGTLREADWAIRTIHEAIELGWKVEINYVQRPLRLAAQGVIERSARIGRWFPLADLPAAHQEAQQSIIRVARYFAHLPSSVVIRFWLNKGTSGDSSVQRLDLSQIDEGGEYSYGASYGQSVDRGGNPGKRENLSERFHRESAQATRHVFAMAVASGRFEPRILARLAGGDPGLRKILEG